MSIVVLKNKLTKEDVFLAREDYETYIKITIDLEQEIVAIGGQYHADAQNVLIKDHGSKKNIWGGGYSILRHVFETNALINIQPDKNPSMEIMDQEIRDKFLKIARETLLDIEKLV